MQHQTLEAAIASKPNTQGAKRLSAVSELLAGKPLDEVSAKFGAGPMLVSKWKRLFDEGGPDLLFKTYPEPVVVPDETAPTIIPARDEQAEAARVLEKLAGETVDAVYRQRLLVVSALLKGSNSRSVADANGIPVSTATSWLQFYRKSGLVGLKPVKMRERKKSEKIALLKDDRMERAAALKTEAQGGSEKYRRRLMAVAVYLETLSWPDAQAVSQADQSVVSRWVSQYMSEGIDGLRSRTEKGKA